MTTDPDRVMDLFAAASEMPTGDREAYLARACAGQPRLLAKLQGLLASEERADEVGFLAKPALEDLAGRVPVERAPQARTGETFGRYRIVKLLGEGGMGEVYLAGDTELNRQVALKLIKNAPRMTELLDRFAREGRILAHLNHENIARLLDAGTTAAGVPFLVMEYVDGKPITEHCESLGLSVSARLDLFRVVCSAVQYAHQNVVVHRDLKPGNILVTAGGHVKLLDFGIAKLLDSPVPPESGATVLPALTPEYASPEQIKGEITTTATDVYSLGVVLFELLTGAGPYVLKRRTSGEMLKAICDQEPRLPSNTTPASHIVAAKALRGDLDQIVLKALRKEPEARYHTVEQFSDDIGRHLEGLPVAARRRTLSYRAGKFVRRNRVVVTAGALVLLTLFGGIAATAWEARVAIREGKAAEARFNEVRNLAHTVLFDYHDAIAGLPGSTPVRKRFVSDALTYLNRMSRDLAGDVALQLEVAAAYLRIGDVQGRPYAPNLGQTEAALASYQKALSILRPIVDRDPANREARRHLANARESIGLIALRQFRFADAVADQRTVLRMREDLLASDSGNAGIRHELAMSHLHLGDALQASCFGGAAVLSCLEDALASQRRSLQLLEQLSREQPGDAELRRNMAEACTKIGFRLRDISGFNHEDRLLVQALESEQRAMGLREEVAAQNPANARDRRNVADQRMLLADAQAHVGDRSSALDGYRSSIAAFQVLAAADPANAEARRDLTFAHFKLATALSQAGQTAAAAQSFAAALAIVQQLLAEDPNNAEDRQQIHAVYQRWSASEESASHYARAVELYARYLEGIPPDVMTIYHLARLNLAAAQMANASPEERRGYRLGARDVLRQCLQLLEEKGGRNSPEAGVREMWKSISHDMAGLEEELR